MREIKWIGERTFVARLIISFFTFAPTSTFFYDAAAASLSIRSREILRQWVPPTHHLIWKEPLAAILLGLNYPVYGFQSRLHAHTKHSGEDTRYRQVRAILHCSYLKLKDNLPVNSRILLMLNSRFPPELKRSRKLTCWRSSKIDPVPFYNIILD